MVTTGGRAFEFDFFLGGQSQNIFFQTDGALYFIPEFSGHQHRGIIIYGMVNRGHNSQGHQLLGQVAEFDAHFFSQLTHRDGVSHFDPAFNGLGNRQFSLAHFTDTFFGPFLFRSQTAFSLTAGIKICPFPDFLFAETLFLGVLFGVRQLFCPAFSLPWLFLYQEQGLVFLL